MLCMSLLLPEYLGTYQSHLFFPEFLSPSPIPMALPPNLTQPSGSAFWCGLDEEGFMYLKKSLGDLANP